jgi:hypothetical protein
MKGLSMPRFDVAHVKEQGVNLIIIPLNSSFGHKPNATQHGIIADLQRHATAAGLAGTVVPVWDSGGGRMSYIAPRNWHPFFQGLSLRAVAANVNKELHWPD